MLAQDRMAARVLHLQRMSTENTALSDRWSVYAVASTKAPQVHREMAADFARLALEAVEELRKLEPARTP
jgi:hypothetical protein